MQARLRTCCSFLLQSSLSVEVDMGIWLKRISLVLTIFLAASQLIRPARTNPPTKPSWEIHATLPVEPAVAVIFARSCDDCHSNRTIWPWYSRVAPASWLVAFDVRKGRRKLNFSEWHAYSGQDSQKLLHEICSEVSDGEMPGFGYSLLHPKAKLSAPDVQAVCSWTRLAGQTPSTRETKD